MICLTEVRLINNGMRETRRASKVSRTEKEGKEGVVAPAVSELKMRPNLLKKSDEGKRTVLDGLVLYEKGRVYLLARDVAKRAMERELGAPGFTEIYRPWAVPGP